MKIAIVTGASSGMGREFVIQLEQYVTVDEIWVIARWKDALDALAGSTHAALRPIPLDLCREESFAALAALLEKEQPDVKLVPHSIVMSIWQAQQKTPKNNQGLTTK